MIAIRTILAGAVGTAVMTMMMLVAPAMGLPRMPIGEMLGGFLNIGSTPGWALHGAIGLVLAGIYALAFARVLPGAPPLRGAAYGFAVFLIAQTVVMPMMGAGLFSGGNVPMIMGSLLGHLVYGGLVGTVYGATAGAPEAAFGAAR